MYQILIKYLPRSRFCKMSRVMFDEQPGPRYHEAFLYLPKLPHSYVNWSAACKMQTDFRGQWKMAQVINGEEKSPTLWHNSPELNTNHRENSNQL